MAITTADTSPSPSPSPALRQPRPRAFSSSSPSPSLLREDCWSEESTHVLIDAWGSHHLSLNRGNLRQHHWLEVASAVNSHHPRRRRTDIQCKNRIDTLKKKYKIEKSKTLHSSGDYVSSWPFFSRLDYLISGHHHNSTPKPETPALSNFPVGPRSVMQRKRALVTDDSFSRNQFAEVAADLEERERQSSGTSSGGGGSGSGGGGKRQRGGCKDGCRELAEAITRFGQVYERVEVVKQEQLIELEKHRMQFAKDLECQRMKLLMDTQLQLARIKRPKHSDDADSYL
ncbi:Trihelix transcription factor ASIL2 [Bienertia sinuspersici]